jgi:hypothetical protein
MIPARLLTLAVALSFAQPVSGQARPVRVASAPAEPSLLNLTTGWARASALGDLSELRMSDGDAELRVWRGFGLAETQAVVLRRAGGHWSAFFARVIRCEVQFPKSVGDTASPSTMRRYVSEARRNCGTPLADVTAGARIIATDTLIVRQLDVPPSDIETAWNDAMSAGAAQLPGRVTRSRTMDDGVTYVMELRRSDEYRAAEIEDSDPPETEAVAQVKRVYAAVRRLIP